MPSYLCVGSHMSRREDEAEECEGHNACFYKAVEQEAFFLSSVSYAGWCHTVQSNTGPWLCHSLESLA